MVYFEHIPNNSNASNSGVEPSKLSNLMDTNTRNLSISTNVSTLTSTTMSPSLGGGSGSGSGVGVGVGVGVGGSSANNTGGGGSVGSGSGGSGNEIPKKLKLSNESLREVVGEEKKNDAVLTEDKKKEDPLRELDTKSKAKVTRTHSASKGSGEPPARHRYSVLTLLFFISILPSYTNVSKLLHSDQMFGDTNNSFVLFSISRRTSLQSDSSSKRSNSGKDDESLRYCLRV
jgi:hypothetical protein